MSRLQRRIVTACLLGIGFAFVLLAVWLSVHQSSPVFAQDGGQGKSPTGDNGYCLICHNQQGRTAVLTDGGILDLFVTPETLADSVHGIHNLDTPVGCVDCHGSDAFPHTNPQIVDLQRHAEQYAQTCASCHTEQTQQIAAGTHAQARIRSEIPADITCVSCHGAHEVHPVAEMICSNCHLDQADFTLPANVLSVEVTACLDCHQTTVREWQQSAHGTQQLACYTCHLPHQQQLRFESVNALCLNCHNQDRDDYIHLSHVQRNCADCHWYSSVDRRAHILTASAQPTGHDNRVEVTACLDCHANQTVVASAATDTNSPDTLSHPFIQAQREIAELETRVEETRQEAQNTAALRLVQGFVVGLALGIVFVTIVLRYRRQRKKPITELKS